MQAELGFVVRGDRPQVLPAGGVQRVEYRLGGSCDAFFEWLQSECEVRALAGGG